MRKNVQSEKSIKHARTFYTFTNAFQDSLPLLFRIKQNEKNGRQYGTMSGNFHSCRHCRQCWETVGHICVVCAQKIMLSCIQREDATKHHWNQWDKFVNLTNINPIHFEGILESSHFKDTTHFKCLHCASGCRVYGGSVGFFLMFPHYGFNIQ